MDRWRKKSSARHKHMKIGRPKQKVFFLERKGQEFKMIVGSFHSTWNGREREVPRCAVRRGVKGTYSGDGTSWVPKYSNSKAQNVSTNNVLLISRPKKKTVKVNHPFTDGSNALRLATITLPSPLWLPAQNPHETSPRNTWTPSGRLPKYHQCPFSSSNSIHPSTPDSLILRQDNHNLRERFLTNLSRPIYPPWNLYTSKYHLRRQTLRLCLMSKAPWGRGLAGLKSAKSRLYIIFHNSYFASIFGDDASGYNVEVFL